MSKLKTHDHYIAQTNEPLRESLVQLRRQLQRILPDAEEIIAYNMPGFNIGKATIIGYASFSKQCGVYVSSEVIAENLDELLSAGFQPTKNGVKFTPSKPIPEKLLEKLVASSRKTLEV